MPALASGEATASLPPRGGQMATPVGGENAGAGGPEATLPSLGRAPLSAPLPLPPPRRSRPARKGRGRRAPWRRAGPRGDLPGAVCGERRQANISGRCRLQCTLCVLRGPGERAVRSAPGRRGPELPDAAGGCRGGARAKRFGTSSACPQGMPPRYLIIIGQDEAELWAYLRQLGDLEEVQILLDRRRARPGLWAERLASDRRQPLPWETDLHARPYLIVSLPRSARAPGASGVASSGRE